MALSIAPIQGTPFVGGDGPGLLQVDIAGLQNLVKNNFLAATAPLATDDETEGYQVGSTWWTQAGVYYFCDNADEDSAVWTLVNTGGGGAVTTVFNRGGAVIAEPDDYQDELITAAGTATNYTPSAANVEGHLSGIDTALGSISSAVIDVFGRDGNVIAAEDDYQASLITNDSAVVGANVDDALNTINTNLIDPVKHFDDAPVDNKTYGRKNNLWDVVQEEATTWTFDRIDTSETDPGTGRFKFNDNSSTALVTKIYINETSKGGIQSQVFLDQIKENNLILVQQQNESANHQVYNTTGPATDNGNFQTIPVEHVSGSVFADNDADCTFRIAYVSNLSAITLIQDDPVGTGAGLAVSSGGAGPTTNLRKIRAGVGAGVTTVGGDIVITATGAGGGQINDLVQVGSGAFIRKAKPGDNIETKSLRSSDLSVTITNNVDDINFQVDVGTNNHVAIDAHIDSSPTIHFTEASIDHTAITNVGTNTHATIDNHIDVDVNPHGVSIGNIDSGDLAELNSKITDATLITTTHSGDATIHFTQAAIDHNAILNNGTNTHTQIDTHIIAVTNPHSVTAVQTAAVPLGGGTMTGPLILNAAPTVDLGASTKKYVDDTIGGTAPHKATHEFTGTDEIDVNLLSGVLSESQSVTIEDEGSPLGQAQILNFIGTGAVASVLSGRATINASDANKLSLSGGTMTGSLVLDADPTVNLGAATKQLVDAHSTSTSNPHSTSIGNISSGSLAQLNVAVTNATLIDTTDARLSDNRAPTDHASNHEDTGGDPIDVTDLLGVLADIQPIGIENSTVPQLNATTLNFNTNLEVTVAAGVATINATGAVPGLHASTHEDGNSDEIDVTGLSGRLDGSQFVEVQDEGGAGVIAHTINFTGAGISASVATDIATVTVTGIPAAHASNHQNGGPDEINIGGLSGLLADEQSPLAHSTNHQNTGSDEIDVIGLSGLLADIQSVAIQDTTTPQDIAQTINFTGDGVTATSDGTTATISIPGGVGPGLLVRDLGNLTGTVTIDLDAGAAGEDYIRLNMTGDLLIHIIHTTNVHFFVEITTNDFTVEYGVGFGAISLSLTDFTTAGAGDFTLSTATGGFTASMVGRYINITGGTNFTVDFFKIATFTDSNNVELTVSPTPGAAGSAGVGSVAINVPSQPLPDGDLLPLVAV